jgi:hemerythrin-like domain-containing protein
MIEAGFSRTAGPVAVMLHEHDSGRRLIGEIAAISGTDGPWTPDQHELLRTSARAYIELLRAHIHKEDNILYPMARRSVPPDAQHGVSTECARVDVERAAQALALTELAHTLIRTYAPAP